MQVSAQLKYLRIAPRKVRLATKSLRGMDVLKAQHQLNFLIKRSAGPVSKLLKSAIANAENNYGLVKENLFIKDLTVDEGVKLKRFMPRAMGQAGMIQKKTSHIRIVLDERVPGLKAKKAEPTAATKEVKREQKETAAKHKKPELEVSGSINKKGVFGDVKNIGRKLFRRKSV